MPVFQGVQVTADGIYGLKQEGPNQPFTPYKHNPEDGSFTKQDGPSSSGNPSGGTTISSGGGTNSKVFDSQGNEIDPRTNEPINKPSPFGKGPQTIYDDKPIEEQAKLQADFDAKRQKLLADYLKINDDIYQRMAEFSQKFSADTLNQLQLATELAKAQNIAEGMKK